MSMFIHTISHFCYNFVGTIGVRSFDFNERLFINTLRIFRLVNIKTIYILRSRLKNNYYRQP